MVVFRKFSDALASGIDGKPVFYFSTLQKQEHLADCSQSNQGSITMVCVLPTHIVTMEIMIVFNGYWKHLEEGKGYRTAIERIFLQSATSEMHLFVEDKSVADAFAKKRGLPTPCKVDHARLHPDRESMILVKCADRTTGWYFTHESQQREYAPAEAKRVWDEVIKKMKRPKRRGEL